MKHSVAILSYWALAEGMKVLVWEMIQCIWYLYAMQRIIRLPIYISQCVSSNVPNSHSYCSNI